MRFIALSMAGFIAQIAFAHQAETKQEETFEQDIVEIPGLTEKYGIQFDRNHAFEINTKFVMEEIIDPATGHYRTENIFT